MWHIHEVKGKKILYATVVASRVGKVLDLSLSLQFQGKETAPRFLCGRDFRILAFHWSNDASLRERGNRENERLLGFTWQEGFEEKTEKGEENLDMDLTG